MATFRSIYAPTLKDLKRKMLLTGGWPKKNASLPYKLVGYLSVCAIAFFCISAFIGTFRTFSNYGDLSYGVCCCITALLFVLKQSILFWNKSRFFEIFDILKNPLFEAHEEHLNVHLINKIRIGSVLHALYLYGGLATAILVGAVPVFYMSKRLIPVPFILDMKQQSFAVYISTWLLQAFGTLLVAWNIPCIDGLIYTFMIIGVAQLEILKHRISHSRDCLSGEGHSSQLNEIDDREDVLVDNFLRKCVLHHVAIDRYITAIENAFTLIFLVQLLLGLVAICFVGLNCIVMPINSLEFARGAIYFFVILIIMAIFCIPGNEINVQSEEIGYACYVSQWEDNGLKVRKTLLLIMERSKRPFRVTAGKFTPMSLLTFLGVLQSAFSYFTVLWQFYSNSKLSM